MIVGCMAVCGRVLLGRMEMGMGFRPIHVVNAVDVFRQIEEDGEIFLIANVYYRSSHTHDPPKPPIGRNFSLIGELVDLRGRGLVLLRGRPWCVCVLLLCFPRYRDCAVRVRD